jgi:2-polyprenyl-6-hydroxyphenyl methylase/3-demethylubiquinone-9 3-methyltransferase
MNNEVEKFEQFGHNWWNTRSGEFKLLHQINPLRLSFIKHNICQHYNINPGLASNNLFAGLSVLDVGCGGGIASIPMARLGASVVGIDPSPAAIDAATQRASAMNLSNVDHICTFPEGFNSDIKFDVILCLDMLEHAENLEQLVEKIVSLLKSDGAIIISTINKTFKAFAAAIVAAEYILGMLPKGTHHYAKLLKPSDLQKLFSSHSFSIKNLQGIAPNILGTWQFCQNLDINYLAYIHSPNSVNSSPVSFLPKD